MKTQRFDTALKPPKPWPDPLGRPRIAVIGDAMRDVWLECEEWKPDESECPVGGDVKRFCLDGAAANVAGNLTGLDCAPTLFHGLDPAGGIPEKTRVLIGGKQRARWDEHDSVEPVPTMPLFKGNFEAIVVSDYCKGGVDAEVRWRVDCVASIVPVFIHTKGDPALWTASVCQHATWFCNRKEHSAYIKSYERCNHVVVTDGEAGSDICIQGSKLFIHHQKAFQVPVLSTCGAGDSYLAGYVVKALKDDRVSECMRYASAAAAVAVSKPRTAVAYAEEVQELLEAQESEQEQSELPARKPCTIFRGGCGSLDRDKFCFRADHSSCPYSERHSA